MIAAGKLLALDTPAGLGGRDTEEATVVWEEAGTRHTLRSPQPTAEVRRLADRFGGEVPGLQVTRPSLEDVYLDLIRPHVDQEVDAAEEVAR